MKKVRLNSGVLFRFMILLFQAHEARRRINDGFSCGIGSNQRLNHRVNVRAVNPAELLAAPPIFAVPVLRERLVKKKSVNRACPPVDCGLAPDTAGHRLSYRRPQHQQPGAPVVFSAR